MGAGIVGEDGDVGMEIVDDKDFIIVIIHTL
jgi:hypothetical protein